MSGFFEPQLLHNCSPWREEDQPAGTGALKWSPLRIEVIASDDSDRVQDRAAEFLAREGIEVRGISHVTAGAGWTAYQYSDGGEPTPHYILTIIYQERLGQPQ